VIDALAPVFNIEVEGAHEYFVGEGEVLVHNGIDCRGRPADATSSADGERLRQSLARREADVRPGVQPYEVGTYGDLTARSRPHDGLQIDHQTSHASNVRREQNRLGRLLSTEEREALRMNSPAVAVPTRWHEQHSRTYGGRNTRAQVARDARYPSIGVALDTAAMVRHAAPEHREAARRAAEAMRSVARRRGRRR
jgi:filamentous hemagglutinin